MTVRRRWWNRSTSALISASASPACGYAPQCARQPRLQIVDVVDKDAFHLVHRRIDVARNGDVDEEHGPVTATMHELLAVLFPENRMRRASGADHNVGFGSRFVELFEGDNAAVEWLG